MVDIIRKYDLFGSTADFVLLDADETTASPILEDADTLGLKLQRIFNFYDPASEISLLNKNRKLKASPELIQVLELALKYSLLSGGEYDVSHGKQFLERKKDLPATEPSCSYKDIQIEGSQIKLMHPEVLVDLGSLAKGFMVDEIILFLMESGAESGYVDGRGDLRLFGKEQIVGIQHPREKGIICQILVRDCGVATSGDYNQFSKSHDKSHILKQKDIISATVVADELITADLFATLFMVLDKRKRESLIEEYPNIKVMTIDKQLIPRYYNHFEELLVA